MYWYISYMYIYTVSDLGGGKLGKCPRPHIYRGPYIYKYKNIIVIRYVFL